MKGIAYTFKTPALLAQALTHPSILPPQEGRVFERLEFLGDRVLGLIIAQWSFENFPSEREGDLAKRLANLVCKETLVEVAHALDLEKSLRMRQEKGPSQRKRLDTLLADACEALIGALYLDGGMDAAKAFVYDYWKPYLLTTQDPPHDPKSVLQERMQALGKSHPLYEVITCVGPAHAPLFVVEVFVEGYPPARGEGSSKQLAEKTAAQTLLKRIECSRKPG